MNTAETRAYYQSLTDQDICDCAYCQNYVRQIRRARPDLASFLDSIGVDIEKPFEAIPMSPDEDGTILYLGVQYAVMGDPQGFRKTTVNELTIEVTDSHPMTDIAEEHFVIETSGFRLPFDSKD